MTTIIQEITPLDTTTHIPFIISLEGNIGAGKSTIYHKLQQYYSGNKDIVFMDEPVNLWNNITDENGESMLVKYYRNPSKYAFGFQTMVYASQVQTYMDTIKENPNCKIIISERSMDAGHNVFTKMLKDEGQIDEIHYKIYQLLFPITHYKLHTIFYIHVTSDLCIERIEKRNRNGETGENGITKEYLMKCEQYYNQWFEYDLDRNTKLYSLDGNISDNGNTCVHTIIKEINRIYWMKCL
jgi:deoxyadenosine/deoxycytidine kinase